VIEVYVLCGYDDMLKIVLKVRHSVQQFPVMMVVDECNRTGNLFPDLPFLRDKFLPYKIPKGLRPIGVILFPDELIELSEQFTVKRNAKSY